MSVSALPGFFASLLADSAEHEPALWVYSNRVFLALKRIDDIIGWRLFLARESVMSTLNDAIEYIRTGQKAEGRQILEALLDVDENNEKVWLWLSTVVDTDEDREICLENTLAIDPNNVIASKGLEAFRAGIFNPEDVLRELLDEQIDGGDEGQVSFIDEFVYADDDDLDGEVEDFDDDELIIPGQQKARSGPNVRFIILGVLIVVLALVLGGLAFVSIFILDGDDDVQPIDTPPSQEVPAQEEPTAEPTATPTETPTPGTPTVTPTSRLQLPTLAPTELPTPTATRVVSPTPIGN